VSPARRTTLLAAALLVASITAALLWGAVPIAPGEAVAAVARALRGAAPASPADAILVEIRAPRVALAALVGAGLSASGATFQALFRNPLADPYVIGVSAGAALGAVLAITAGMSGLAVPAAAFLTALASVALVLGAASRGARPRVENLLLAGLAIGALFSAVLAIVLALDRGSLAQALAWLAGGFGGRGWPNVAAAAPFLAGGYALARLNAREMNLMLASDDEATSLGLDVPRVRRRLVTAATLLAAASAASAGLIGFVGLIVPHAVRRLSGPDHRGVLPAAALLGAALTVAADVVARVGASPVEIPVGAVTALLGVPFFLWLLAKSSGQR
jgi:iron complex transport system permease protein